MVNHLKQSQQFKYVQNQTVSLGQNQKFSKVISAYEHIRELEVDLFKLRLMALNARILAIRTGGKGAAGFGVVAEAIIPFSNRMENICKKLIFLCGSVLKLASLNAKDSKNEFLLLKTLNKVQKRGVSIDYSKSLENGIVSVKQELIELVNQMEEEISQIHAQIRLALRLCLDGQMISIQIRIESTYVIQNIADFKNVAGAFNESLENIQSAIRTIQKDL